MRSARAGVPRRNEPYERAADQSRLLVEVARRVAEPVESLPKGSRPPLLMTLYRDAIFWALVADEIARTGLPPSGEADLAQLWTAAPQERLARLAGDEAGLAAVRAALLDRSPTEALGTSAEEATRARELAEALLWELDAPARTVEHVQVQRWTRVGLVVAALALVVFGARVVLRGPNLASARVFKTSSVYPECTPPNRCGDIFFHTMPQESPWIDFDLGAVKTIHQVEVSNRSDCCAERAIPLIAEVSTDDKQWVQVARRDSDFSVWKADFPKHKARYVRFRVPRSSTLHFDDVAIR